MAITATAGGVSATIKPNRPSWADMEKHYPGREVPIDILYNVNIKGEFLKKENDKSYANTCAICMSHALLRSGLSLPEAKGSIQGGNGKWYSTRVDILGPELVKRFKGFDAELKFQPVPEAAGLSEAKLKPYAIARKAEAQKFIDVHIKGKKGIVMFRVAGWDTARGHFTL